MNYVMKLFLLVFGAVLICSLPNAKGGAMKKSSSGKDTKKALKKKPTGLRLAITSIKKTKGHDVVFTLRLTNFTKREILIAPSNPDSYDLSIGEGYEALPEPPPEDILAYQAPVILAKGGTSKQLGGCPREIPMHKKYSIEYQIQVPFDGDKQLHKDILTAKDKKILRLEVPIQTLSFNKKTGSYEKEEIKVKSSY